MNDILHDLVIAAEPQRVFRAVATPEGLDQWWTLRAAGEPRVGAEYELDFGPGFDWRARVSACEPDRTFELELTHADGDWTGSRLRFDLSADDGMTRVRFQHTGWPEANAHYRTSCYCWAMYLRVMRRWLEHGETVPYEQRLDV